MVIPDGDRRYAKREGISLLEAYKEAAAVVRNLVEWFLVKHDLYEFTFFGLSHANVTKRSEADLDVIMEVETQAIKDFALDQLFHENAIRVNVYGETYLLPQEFQDAILEVQNSTKDYKKHVFNMLISYSGALDISNAVNKLQTSADSVNFNNLRKYCRVNTPIDFVIRSASEKRISDGPMLSLQYAEFHYLEEYFPEITEEVVDEAINEYRRRNRSFGI